MKTISIPRKLTVLIDTREKKPLVFPRQLSWVGGSGYSQVFEVEAKLQHLPTGDYAICGYEAFTLVETKRSLSELDMNIFSPDNDRTGRCLARLVNSCSRPLIYLDFPSVEAAQILHSHRSPEVVWDAFWRIACRFGIEVITSVGRPTPGTKLFFGEMILRRMWNLIWLQENGYGIRGTSQQPTGARRGEASGNEESPRGSACLFLDGEARSQNVSLACHPTEHDPRLDEMSQVLHVSTQVASQPPL